MTPEEEYEYELALADSDEAPAEEAPPPETVKVDLPGFGRTELLKDEAEDVRQKNVIAQTRLDSLKQLLAFTGGGGGKMMRLFGGDEAVAESEKAQAEYPKTAIAGMLTPALLSGGANVGPALAGRFGTSLPAVARAVLAPAAQRVAISAGSQGAAGALGAQPGERIEGALSGTGYGALGGIAGEAIGAAAAPVLRAAAPLTGKLADTFKQWGLEAGRKVLQGQSTLRAQAKKPLSLEAVQEVADRGALRPGRDVIETADNVLEARKAAGERVSKVIDELADLGAPGVDLRNLARRLREEYSIAKANMEPKAATDVYAQKLEMIRDVANMRKRAGQNPFQTDLKQAEVWKRNWQSEADAAGAYSKIDPREPAEAKAKVASLIRQANEGVAGTYAQSINKPELLQEFLDAKQSYGKLADAYGFAEKAASKDIQRAAGPGVSGKVARLGENLVLAGVVGGAAGGGGLASGMTPESAATLALLAGGGALAKRRGGTVKAATELAIGRGLQAAAPAMSQAMTTAAGNVTQAAFPLGSATGAYLAKKNAYKTLEDYLGLSAKDDEDLANQAYIAGQTTPAAQPGRQ